MNNETRTPWTPGKWKAFRKPTYLYEEGAMTTTGHDPDRWILRSEIDHTEGDPVTHTTVYLGEIVRCGTMSDSELEANARLIAAARDLYEACSLLEDAEEHHHNDCEECGGEGEPELCSTCFPLFDDARCARRLAIAKARGETP